MPDASGMVPRMPAPTARRPLTTRDASWARAFATALARRGASPDLISATSIPVALAGATALLLLPAPLGPILCALGVQARLLCNLFDGMVAIEGGRGGPVGPLWNELPDRVADSVLLIALGMAAGNTSLGWAAALMAALTAYVRATGGALGIAQDFSGVQSKPKRMFVITVACVIAAAAPWWAQAHDALLYAAWFITVGSAITAGGRTWRLAKQLRARAVAASSAASPPSPPSSA